MATVYTAPIPAPDTYATRKGEDFADAIARWSRDEAEYIKRIQTMARANGTHKSLGMVVRFPYADGFAQYVLWKVKPLQLVHLAIGDAWDLPDYVTRGIRLADIVSRAGRMPAGGPVD